MKIIFRIKNEPQYLSTQPELDDDTLIVRGLTPSEMYEFKVVAVDGDYLTESNVQEVDTYGVGKRNRQTIIRYFYMKKLSVK